MFCAAPLDRGRHRNPSSRSDGFVTGEGAAVFLAFPAGNEVLRSGAHRNERPARETHGIGHEDDRDERFQNDAGAGLRHGEENPPRGGVCEATPLFRPVGSEGEGVRKEHHLIGVKRSLQEEVLVIDAGGDPFREERAVGFQKSFGRPAQRERRERAEIHTEGRRDAAAGILVKAKAFVRIVVVGDDAVVLEEEDAGTFPAIRFDAPQLVADGESEPGARIDIGNDSDGVAGPFEGFSDDGVAFGRTGREVGPDGMRVRHVSVQKGVEARLHGRAQRLQTVDRPDACLCALRPRLLDVGERRRVRFEVEPAQGGAVEDDVRAVGTDVRKPKAGGLDGHEAAVQLDGGVAAAALDIVGTGTDMSGNGGKGRKVGSMIVNELVHAMSS